MFQSQRIPWKCIATAALFLGFPHPSAQAQLASNTLPTGRQITPVGTLQDVGSLPTNIALTPDGKYAIVTDMGFREYLTCLDVKTGQLPLPGTQSQLPFPSTHADRSQGLFYGLAVATNADGTSTVYAAQGGHADIAVVRVGLNGSLTQTGQITMRPTDFPAGLSLDADGHLAVAVSRSNSDNLIAVGTTPGYLVVYDTKTEGVITPLGADQHTPAPEAARVPFNGGADTFGTVTLPPTTPNGTVRTVPFTPTNFPFAVAAMAHGARAFVGSERDGVVYAVDYADTAHPRVIAIPTGSHPDCLLLDKAQTRLFVANAQNDTISIVDTAADAVERTLSVGTGTDLGKLPGSTPTGLALSSDEQTLYVTLGDLNAVAVIDVASGKVRGYLPTGWYPSAVAALSSPSEHGETLLVTSAKGVQAVNPNPLHIKPTPQIPQPNANAYYDENIIEGTVSRIALADENLKADTAKVLANNGIAPGERSPDPLPRDVQGLRGIKHVIYIIKENRTYDQILGDMPQGNGDPSLAMFGREVTPNEHALAERFVLLDNFYDCAEVSADGWNWSTQGIANEYVIKNVPYNYGGRGGSYDFEGANNNYPAGGFPAKDPDGAPSSTLFPQGGPAITDVAEAAHGHIWDLAERGKRSYRNYGFFLSGGMKGLIPDNYPSATGLQPGGHYTSGALKTTVNGRSDVDFRQFDLDYPDSDGPTTGYSKTHYGKFQAPDRFAEWNREFQAMLKSDPTGRSVPDLMLVRFMSDHTAGYQLGKATPSGHVADNDYAVGELVQAVSRSPIWKSTAIFVIEDDSQDGPDHVDCHRSTAFVISPWIRPNSVDHHFYNTDSILHTMELILGLPPLSQYDAIAPPINDFGNNPQNTAEYVAQESSEISQTAAKRLAPNSPLRTLVALTATMDFSKEDLAPPQLLNRVIWQSVKGFHATVPSPQHHVVLTPLRKANSGKAKTQDDDDD